MFAGLRRVGNLCSNKFIARPLSSQAESTFSVVVISEDKPFLKVLDKCPSNVKLHIGLKASDFPPAFLQQADVCLFCAGTADPSLLRDIFPSLPSLKWIQAFSAGVNNILFPDLINSDVMLTNAKGVYSYALGEYAMMSCLYFAKQVPLLRSSQIQGRWEKQNMGLLRGKQMAVIGYGDIGQAVGNLARGFGMKIVGVRRRTELSNHEVKNGSLEAIYSPASINKAIEDSDYIVICTPLTTSTKHLMGEKQIQCMKKDAVLINLGRGDNVDETSVLKALQSNAIKGAALDVFQTEPLPHRHPLYKQDNLLLSPHCADSTQGSIEEAMELFLKNLNNYMQGRDLCNIVDKTAGY